MDISGYANYNDYWMAKTNGGTTGLVIGDVNGTSDKYVPTEPQVALDTSKVDTYVKSNEYAHLEQMIAEGKVESIDMSQGTSNYDDPDRELSNYEKRLEGMELLHPPKSEGYRISNMYDPDGKRILFPSEANEKAEEGSATHGFVYVTRDFLEESAEMYALLEEGEMYRTRNISDSSFVENTLDFFTGGNYTQEDYDLFQDQMTDVVFELAEQLKNGEELDFSKVETTLTIGGVDTTLGEIFEFQQAAYDMETTLRSSPSYAEIGMVESVANAFGSDKGELGQMFSDAMGELCDKAATKREESAGIWQDSDLPDINKAFKADEHKQYTAITEAYSKLDTSSKESLEASFKEAQKEHEAILKQFDAKYGISGSMDYDAELKAASEMFNKLMEMFDEEPENHYLK